MHTFNAYFVMSQSGTEPVCALMVHRLKDGHDILLFGMESH